MRLLLDTHVIIWAMLDAPQLKPGWRDRILDAEAIFISSVSVWEVAIKTSIGKLDAPGDLFDRARAVGCLALPVTWEHAQAVRGLPPHHGDPFDRMLIAQALSEDLALMSADAKIASYGDLIALA